MGDAEKRDGPQKGAVEPPGQPAAGYVLNRSVVPSPGQLASKRVAVFVDGFNLYHGLHEAHQRKFLWLDLMALGRELLKPDQRLVGVEYFTARVRNHQAGAARQATYLAALRAGGVRVVEGRFQEKSVRCRRCGADWRSYEEKESDVNLCVALLEAARTRRFDVGLVVSGDSDMVPAVRAARAMSTSLRLIAAFPPRRSSEELKRAVHGHTYISTAALRRAQLPELVTASDGRTYQRPDYWS